MNSRKPRPRGIRNWPVPGLQNGIILADFLTRHNQPDKLGL
jgi:hypothetical protein